MQIETAFSNKFTTTTTTTTTTTSYRHYLRKVVTDSYEIKLYHYSMKSFQADSRVRVWCSVVSGTTYVPIFRMLLFYTR